MCSHTYHKTCLETMLEYGVNADCPSCRSPIDGMEFITRGVLKLLRSGYPERAAQLICCIFPVGQEELVDVVMMVVPRSGLTGSVKDHRTVEVGLEHGHFNVVVRIRAVEPFVHLERHVTVVVRLELVVEIVVVVCTGIVVGLEESEF